MEFYPTRACGSNNLFYERQSKAKHQLLSTNSLGGLDHLTLFTFSRQIPLSLTPQAGSSAVQEDQVVVTN